MTIIEPNTEPQIHLASRSPRRLALLSQIGVRVTLIDGDIDETQRPGETPQDYVRRMALDKARAGHARLAPSEQRPVLGADTAVILGETTLGKPGDAADAARMLRCLSGRSHQVLTAVALIAGSREHCALSMSRVTFRPLGEREILRYCATGEPLDKAGAYAIQGYGALFVSQLQGSFSGVMGLPLYETGQLLARAGIGVLDGGETPLHEPDAVRETLPSHPHVHGNAAPKSVGRPPAPFPPAEGPPLQCTGTKDQPSQVMP